MGEKKKQIRASTQNFAVREDGNKKYIEGYFAVFDSPYELWGGSYETIAPTAFDNALDADIRCLIDHDTRLVLGRTKAGTLELRVDQKGLWGRVEINQNDQDALNLYARVERGDVNQCSFGFFITEEEIEYLPDDRVHWTIKAVELFEVSVVTFPAYEDTAVSARKRDHDAIVERKHQAWKQTALKRLKGEERC